jgi:DNA-binding PadR family transcriptional regulator
MAIIGILIEDPNITVAEVAEAVEERFPEARWDSSTVYNALPQMARSKYGLPRVRCTHQTHPDRGRKTQDRYEPTRAGAREFRDWMVGGLSGIPALREALFGRVALCRRLEDLPHLIQLAREEAVIAQGLYSKASVELKHHLDLDRERATREDDPDREPTEEELLIEARQILLKITPAWWAARHQHNTELADQLTKVAEKGGLVIVEASVSARTRREMQRAGLPLPEKT